MSQMPNLEHPQIRACVLMYVSCTLVSKGYMTGGRKKTSGKSQKLQMLRKQRQTVVTRHRSKEDKKLTTRERQNKTLYIRLVIFVTRCGLSSNPGMGRHFVSCRNV